MLIKVEAMKKQAGFTLIEIMVALTVGLIVVSATIAVYIATIRSSADTVRSTRLNHDLDSVIALISNDLRRAGYWGGAIGGSDATENPYTVISGGTTTANFAPTNVTVMNFTDDDGTVRTNGCILYSYDADGDGHYDDDASGAFNSGDDTNEFYGFRFNVSSTGAGVIEIRKTGTTTADCTEGDWETLNVTDGGEAVEITNLTFTDTSKCLNVSDASPCVTTAPGAGDKVAISRDINVSLVANSLIDDSVTKTLNSNIKIRNDRHYRIP